MHIKILGSAADGGFPQLNCACRNCSRLRAGTFHGKQRAQTQIAFSPMPDIWFLIGTSPDLRAQILATREFSSPQVPENSPIAGVFLPNADVASVMGLLHLRGLQNYFVFATPAVQRILRNENRIFKAMDHADSPVQWQPLVLRRRIGCHLSDNPGDAPTFFYTAMSMGGDFPEYASDDLKRNCAPDDASIGLLLEQGNKKLFISPSISGRHSEWLKTAASADVAILDGTLPLGGPEGLLAQYPQDAHGRKILIRLNHNDAILDESSNEHRAVTEAGFEIAEDGMDIQL
jgi:pyrroloquinoline quinone biosynthesis protein B